MSKYTSGKWEWKIKEKKIRICGELIKEHNGKHLKYPRQRIIGETFGLDEEGLANAHLIASAPELLEACKLALGYCWKSTNYNPEKELEKAIAKAESR